MEVPDKLASSLDFYSFTKENGERDTETIERMLGRLFETNFKPLYKVLRNKKSPTPPQWEALLSFVAVTMGRVPAQVENTKQMIAALVGSLEKRNADPEMISHFREMATQEKALLLSMATNAALVHDLNRMHWQFLHATGTSRFCTCDNPVVRHVPANSPGHHLGPGLRNKSVEVTFPLSKKICALATWASEEVLHVDVADEVVDHIAERTVHYATEHVYSGVYDENLMALVKKHSGPPFTFVVH